MRGLAIEWRDGDAGGTLYLINGDPVGSDREGFDSVLAAVRGHPEAPVLVRKARGALGGEDLLATTPFADRYAELLDALGPRQLTWSLL